MTVRLPLALVIGVALAVQAIAGSPQDQLQFRAGTDVVAVDFYAVDKDGNPVLGLRPEELALKVGKARRPIRSLEFIRVAPSEDVDTPTPAAERTPLAFGSNLPQDTGRMVFLLVEAMAPEDQLAVKTAIPVFLDQLSPRDRVGLVTFPRGQVQVDLTTDRARILNELAYVSVHAGSAGAGMGGCDSAASRESLDALIDILDGIAHLDGPKVVIIVSQSLLHQRNQGCISWEYDRAAQAASAARAHIYGLMPRHFESSASVRGRLGSDGFVSAGESYGGGDLGDLIAATGGEQFYVSGTATYMFTRIARESSAYYLLGFDTTDTDRNGKSHDISLTTTRPGVTIRARPSFTVESTKDAAKHATVPSPAGPVRALLDDYSQHRDLPLRVGAYTFRDTADTVRIVAATDVPGGGTLSQVEFALFDVKGSSVSTWPAPAIALGHSQATASTTIAPGPYRLRAAASDDAGRLGAVDFEFTAGLTKAGAFTLSDLMLGEIAGKDVAPRLAFGSQASATAYVELYGAVPAMGAKLSVVFEVADQMNSPAVVTAPGTIEPTREPDRFIVTATVPLASLMPSDYVVRAIVRGPNGELGRVVRTLHKNDR